MYNASDPSILNLQITRIIINRANPRLKPGICFAHALPWNIYIPTLQVNLFSKSMESHKFEITNQKKCWYALLRWNTIHMLAEDHS